MHLISRVTISWTQGRTRALKCQREREQGRVNCGLNSFSRTQTSGIKFWFKCLIYIALLDFYRLRMVKKTFFAVCTLP